jgi:tRNA(His) 5'-end guanylyltransferase
MNDDLGDRMKSYEMAEAGRRLLPLVPVLARLDGRAFHSFTRGLARPYDPVFSQMMVDTALWLAQESNAVLAYTQSDEITLAWHSPDYRSQLFFDGRIQKMTSVLAGLASAWFNRLVMERLPDRARLVPVFDCRVWSVPSREEAANAILWRERDATRNSISMAAQAHYSHRALDGKSSSEMQEMLWHKGVNWNDFPSFFKRGTYVQRRTVRRPFTAGELDQLPPLHEARRNPDLVIERTQFQAVEMPPLGKVINRAAVIFDGAEPVTA